MKTTTLSLLALCISLNIRAQITVQWTDSLEVATATQPITAPRVLLLHDGTPLITWGTSGNPSRIWCTRFEFGSFTAPVSVVQAPNQPSLFGFGGYDVAVSDSQVFVVFEQLQSGIFLCHSDDHGFTFSAPVVVQGPVSGGYSTLSAVAIDGTGNPIVSYILDKNGATYQVRRSADGGLTFGDPVLANAPAPGGLVCECCSSDLLTSGDSVWIVFRNNNSNLRDIWVSRSTNLATSFDDAADVDSTNWHLNQCPIAGPQMARSGDSLITAWMSAASGVNRVFLSTVNAIDMQAGTQLSFPPEAPQNSQNQADITANGDTLGFVFVEKSKELVFHYSTEGTSGLLNQTHRFSSANHTLRYPSIAFRNGVYHLVYVDGSTGKVLYRRGFLTHNSLVTGLEQPEIQVYPNPGKGVFLLSAHGQTIQAITIWNAQGSPVAIPMSQPVLSSPDVPIDLRAYPNGLYFINIHTPTGTYCVKVLKH